MTRPARLLILLSSFAFVGACATTSAESQRGVAADEQRKAADEHNKSVQKAIDEGKPIPSQPQAGDGNPDGGAL